MNANTAGIVNYFLKNKLLSKMSKLIFFLIKKVDYRSEYILFLLVIVLSRVELHTCAFLVTDSLAQVQQWKGITSTKCMRFTNIITFHFSNMH